MKRNGDSRQEATDDGTAKEDVACNENGNHDDDHVVDQPPRNSNDLIIDEGFPVLNNFVLPTRSTKPNPNSSANQKQIDENDRMSAKKDDYDPSIIPRYSYATFPSALTIEPSQMTNILSDFREVFDARTKEDSAAYSTGSTYFMPAGMKPRCVLEDLALKIFKSHTDGLVPGKHYDLERSGAEWWTLVLDSSEGKDANGADDDDGGGKPKAATMKKNDEAHDDGGGKPKAVIMKNDKEDLQECGEEEEEKYDDDSDGYEEEDEVGMHFDADYGLEQQLPNFMLHPRVATVTYLSDIGVPTLVLDKRPPPSADVQKASLNGPIEKGLLSCPVIGKHIAFDGRLLHGAPGEYFPAGSINRIRDDHDVDDDGRTCKRRKLDNGDTAIITGKQSESKSIKGSNQRVTFMVNVWLNHCPLDAEPIEDDLIASMKTVWKDEKEEKDSSTAITSSTGIIEKEKDAAVGVGLNTVDKKCKASMTTSGCTPPFRWSLQNVKVPTKVQKVEITGTEKMSSWAGSETTVMCNREVAMQFRSTIEDCHRVSQLAFDANGKSIELSFQRSALCLEVGAEVVDSSSDEEA